MNLSRETVCKLEEMLFTTSAPEDKQHLSVIAFDRQFAVTFRHGPHSTLQLGEKLFIYNVIDRNQKFEMSVFAVSISHDVMILKQTEKKFESIPTGLGSVYRGEKYRQLGVDQDREPKWKDGVISEKKMGFYIGTSYGSFGDSGSAILDKRGNLLGITVTNSIICSGLENMHSDEVAEHPITLIISCDTFLGIGNIGGPGISEDTCSHYVTHNEQAD